MEEICQGKDKAMAVKEREIRAKQRALSEAEQQVGSLAEECATLKGNLEGNTEKILSLQADVQTLQVTCITETVHLMYIPSCLLLLDIGSDKG